VITTVDYHTAGEPFRIVTAGAPDIPGSTVLERREAAIAGPADRLRALLCNEPRGHADMYGCFLVPPDDAGALLGTLFWHKDGFSTACGHGTIALGAYAIDAGLVSAPDDGAVEVVIDVPSGRVTARAERVAGRTRSVAFRNVPAYPLSRAVPVATSGGEISVDLSYGGAGYASARAADLGLSPLYMTAAWLADESHARSVRAYMQAREVDLIEEVARHYGFDRLPTTFPALTAAAPPIDPRILRARHRQHRLDALLHAGELQRAARGCRLAVEVHQTPDRGAVNVGDARKVQQ